MERDTPNLRCRQHTLMIGETTWPSCHADPARGIAEFDGLVIEADSMTRSSLDRVLPIFAEEQISMCRLMDPLLIAKPGTTTLDVGTGSGVFAIWAARRGKRVIGIDINPRAIQFARRNAIRNGVPVVDSRVDLVDGSIFFEVRAFDECFVRNSSVTFDFIFLNPPYNPTAPGIVVALHADAGADGQEAFRQQMTLVPRVLGAQGICIGNQMGIVANDQGQPSEEILQVIRSAFDYRCRVRFTRMMEEGNDTPVDHFLRELYLPLVREGKLMPDVIERYIHKTARRDAAFALFYYEISRQSCWESSYFSPAARPNTTWENRLWIHKCILETAEYRTDRPPEHQLAVKKLDNYKPNREKHQHGAS